MPIRIGATGLVGALVFHGTTALAANPPPPRVSARLDYRAPEGTCPPAPVLRAEVARHFGYDPFTAVATTRIVASIGVEGRGLTARLEAFDGADRGEWSKPLQAADGACSALLSRMGNAIAFYLDPLIFSGAASEHGPIDAPRPESPKLPERELPKPRPLPFFELGLSPLLTLGAPEAAFGLLGHVGFRWSMLSIGLELRYDPPRSAQVSAPRQSLRMEAGGCLWPM